MSSPAWLSPEHLPEPQPQTEPAETPPPVRGEVDEPRLPRDQRRPRRSRVTNTENMGRPRVGTGKPLGPYEAPQELRDLVERFQADQGFTKQADAVRTLLTAGLWAEGYDEAETLQVVYTAPVLRYRPADGALTIRVGGKVDRIDSVEGFGDVDRALSERGLVRRSDHRGQWHEDAEAPGTWVATTRRADGAHTAEATS